MGGTTSLARSVRERAVRLIPWLIAGAWLAATLCAFGFFELRLPRGPWCVS
jgi:hypothetical protein